MSDMLYLVVRFAGVHLARGSDKLKHIGHQSSLSDIVQAKFRLGPQPKLSLPTSVNILVTCWQQRRNIGGPEPTHLPIHRRSILGGRCLVTQTSRDTLLFASPSGMARQSFSTRFRHRIKSRETSKQYCVPGRAFDRASQ